MSLTSRAAYLKEKAEHLAQQHDLDADRTELERRKEETHEPVTGGIDENFSLNPCVLKLLVFLNFCRFVFNVNRFENIYKPVLVVYILLNCYQPSCIYFGEVTYSCI